MKIITHEDELGFDDRIMRTSVTDMATIQVRPWVGSADIRIGHGEVNIDVADIPELIRLLKLVVAEERKLAKKQKELKK